MDPYRMATSWVKPQGSKIDGTRMKSEPAYICSRIMNLYYTTIFQLDDVGRRSSPDAKEAHHRLNKASPVRGLHHAEYQPSCKNHFVFEDLELNQAKPPRNQIHHFHQFSFEVNKQKQIQKKTFSEGNIRSLFTRDGPVRCVQESD